MVTRYLKVNDDPLVISYAAGVIRAGGLVAFPTETVYGLGANATDANAVALIYAAKQRALNDPLIVHCAPEADITLNSAPADEHPRLGNQAPLVVDMLARQQIIGDLTMQQRKRANALMGSFWPGPLPLVLPRGGRIPANVTAGLDSVAVRMPDHPVALALIRQSGVPIAAPSANRFGHVSPTTAQHVRDDLDGRIDLVLDGGASHIGVESTVLDLSAERPIILRPGGLARADIERVIGQLAESRRAEAATTDETAQVSPGMLSKHYAPRAELRVVADIGALLRARDEYAACGVRAGLLVLASQVDACAGLEPLFVLGDDLAGIARNLYAGLRALDSDGVEVILVSAVERAGIGEAIADRLRRGATR